MRISDWSSDVCSSDLLVPVGAERYADFGGAGFGHIDAGGLGLGARIAGPQRVAAGRNVGEAKPAVDVGRGAALQLLNLQLCPLTAACAAAVKHDAGQPSGKRRGRKTRSAAHTSELQSLTRTYYEDISLQKK